MKKLNNFINFKNRDCRWRSCSVHAALILCFFEKAVAKNWIYVVKFDFFKSVFPLEILAEP